MRKHHDKNSAKYATRYTCSLNIFLKQKFTTHDV